MDFSHVHDVTSILSLTYDCQFTDGKIFTLLSQ